MADGQTYEGEGLTEVSSLPPEGADLIEVNPYHPPVSKLQDFQSELDSAISSPDFFDKPYEEQASDLSKIYFGPNEDGTRHWDPAEEDKVRDAYKEALTAAREYDGKKITRDDYNQFLLPPPDLAQATNADEAGKMLDQWEGASLTHFKTEYAKQYLEMGDVAEQQVGQYVDEAKQKIQQAEQFPEATDTSTLAGRASLIPSAEKALVKGAASVFADAAGFLTDKIGLTTDASDRWRRAVETSKYLTESPDLANISVLGVPVETIASGLGGTLAVAETAIATGGVAGAGAATVASMGAGARMGYRSGYEQVFAKTQDEDAAIKSAWLNAGVQSVSSAFDLAIARGLIPYLGKAVSNELKIGVLTKLAKTGALGDALKTGFGVAGAVGAAGAVGVAQEAAIDYGTAAITGDASFAPTQEKLTAAGLTGGLTGLALGGAEILRPGRPEAARVMQEAEAQSRQIQNESGTPPPPEPPSGTVLIGPGAETVPETVAPIEETKPPVSETVPPAEETKAPPPETQVQGAPIENVPLKNLEFNAPEVPQFKGEADERGIVSPLKGEITEFDNAPIVVFEKTDGRQIIATGRHRADLYLRNGRETIPAQVLREADGWTAHDMQVIDAESNIKNDKGSVEDYVGYFQDRGYSESEAEARGLLSNDKGQQGFSIATKASPDLLTAFSQGDVNAEAAAKIADAAPGNADIQDVGIKAVKDGKTPEFAEHVMSIEQRRGGLSEGVQEDMFGRKERGRDAALYADTAIKMKQEASAELGRLTATKKLGKAGEEAQANIPGAEVSAKVTDKRAIQARAKELQNRIKFLSPKELPYHPEIEAEVISRMGEELAKTGEQLGLSLSEIQKPEQPDSEDLSKLDAPARMEALAAPIRTPPPRSVPEALDMAKIEPKIARIEPAPIVTEGEAKPPREIIFDVAKSLGAKVQYRGQSRKAVGTYFPGSAKTSIRYQGDLDTTAHELGHVLDDRFGIVGEWAGKRQRSPYDAEIIDLFSPYGSPAKTLQKKRAEGVAEYIRAWAVNPEKTEQVAPKFTEFFKSKLSPEALSALEGFGNDIRRFAGAKGEEKILANLQWEPDGKLDQLKSFMFGSKANGFEISFWDKIATRLTDRLRPFEAAIDYAKGEKGIDKLLPENDPLVLARLYAGSNAKVEEIFRGGMVDADMNRVTGGLSWLFSDLDTTTGEKFDREAKLTAAMMIAERTIEKARQFADKAETPEQAVAQLSRQDISGIGGGLAPDLQVAEETIRNLQQDPKQYERLQAAAGKYRQFADAVLRYAVDKGRMSEELYQTIKQNNEYYVAMQRVRELEPGQVWDSNNIVGGKDIGIGRKIVNTFKGSARDIVNPYTSLMESVTRTVRETDRNEVVGAFVDLLEGNRKMYEGEPNTLASVGSRAKGDEPNTIPYWRNGELEHWRMDKDVYETLKGLQTLSNLPGWATFIPSVLRNAVVYSPPFAVRNVMRDIQHRIAVSESGLGRSIAATFKHRGEMESAALALYGGDQGGHYLSDKVNYARALRSAMNDASLQKNSIFLNPLRIVDGYTKFINESEHIGRLSEYEAAFKKAKTDLDYNDYNAHLYAAAQARGIMDFAVGGTVMKQLNQIIPFLNPGVQGMRRTLQSAKTDPVGFAMRWTLMAVLPALATRYIAAKLGYEDEYDQLPEYQKDLFYNFKAGPNTWIRIPKSYEIGALASGVERATAQARGRKNAFEGYGGSLARALLPADESALAGPLRGLVGALANKDFFRDKQIVPFYDEKKALELRNTKGASQFGQGVQSLAEMMGFGSTELGRKLFDARVVDYIVREQFGNLGNIALSASDLGTPRKSSQTLAKDTTGIFTQAPAYASRDVQWIFNFADQKGLGSNSKYLKQLEDSLHAYSFAPSDAAKEKAAEKVRSIAATTRDFLERSEAGIDKQQSIKAKQKQAKEERQAATFQ